jgi:YVTN family beta-propeller protein
MKTRPKLFSKCAVISLLLFFGVLIIPPAPQPRAAQEKAASDAPTLLVLNKLDNTLAIIDPVLMKVLGTVATGEGPHEVITSADGRTAYVANYGAQKPGNSLSVIDLITRKEIKRVELGALLRPHGMVEAGGKIYFTAEVNRAVARYNPVSGSVDWMMGTGQNGTHLLCVTRDERKIYTANIGSDTVTVMEFNAAPPAPSKITHISVGKQPEGLDLSPDGRELWVGHNGDGGVSIIDTATNSVKETIKVGKVPIRIKFTPDGKRVLISDPERGELAVFDHATRKEVKRIAVGEVPVGILVTPDGKRAFVATMQAGRVVAVNLEDLSVAGHIEPGKGPDGLGWAVIRQKRE